MLDLAQSKRRQQKTHVATQAKNSSLFQRLQKKFSNEADLSAHTLLDTPNQAEYIAQTAQQNDILFRKAHFDSLTHLPNRAYFNEILEHFVVSSHNQDMQFALLFLDLDGFKAVNDQMGHRTGDDLLRHVAARLIFSVREEDKVFRLGGDEFVILLPEITEHDIIETIAQRIIQEISHDYWIGGQAIRISTSIGIALFPKNAKLASELIEHADQALYAAKEKGKGIALFYEDSYLPPKQKFAAEIADLERAIEAAEIATYQSEHYSLEQKDLEIIQLSACWQQQDLPHWQPALEASNYAKQVGFWLIDHGFYQLNQIQNTSETKIAIPLIAKLLQHPHLAEKLSQSLKQHQIQAQQVLLQMHANDWQNCLLQAQNLIETLVQQGFHFLIEGIDESNFNLKNIQSTAVQVVQLNASWVLQAKYNQQLENVKILVQMLQLLNKKVSLEEGILEPHLMQTLGIDWIKTLPFLL